MLAWLHATPKPPEGSKRAEAASNTGQAAKDSRLDRMKRDGIETQMPPNPAPQVIAWLIDLGITEATGMGPKPLTWTELEAWQRGTGVPLAPWMSRMLRHLSAAYIAEGREAESETRAPPWRAEVTPDEREIVEARLRMVLG